jgi:DNA-binding GntR family transcriptional regulator
MTQEQMDAINNALTEIDKLETQVTKRRIIECLAALEAAAGVQNGWAATLDALLEEQRQIIRDNS